MYHTQLTQSFLHQKYEVEKLSMDKIASIIGCSKATVHRALLKFGFKNIRKAKSIVGNKYGKLLIINCLDTIENYQSKYRCLCDCNNYCYISRNNLLCNTTTSCGCLHRRRGKNHPMYKGFNDLSSKFWFNYQNHAKERNLEFSISMEYAWNLFIKQNRKCALTGQEIILVDSQLYNIEQTASLDRIDSTKGYIEGNVQWVHKWVNICKWNLTQKEFIKMCHLVANNNSLDSH